MILVFFAEACADGNSIEISDFSERCQSALEEALF